MGRQRDRRRVVVTGLGCVTPLGPDVASTWASALAGASAAGPIHRFDARHLAVRIAAEVGATLDLDGPAAAGVLRRERSILLALASAREALADARLDPSVLDRGRIGVAIGSGIGGVEPPLANHRVPLASRPRRGSPFLVPMTIANMASGSVSIRYRLEGPTLCHVGAGASGLPALGEAMRTIERGDADVMLAGGTEAAVHPLVVAEFTAMRALSTRNEAPARACRPFDRERDGFVIGEGAAVCVVEAREHARARGARVRAELLGYAATADPGRSGASDPDGPGAQQAMERSLVDAGLGPEAIDWIHAHATGAPEGDRVEAEAIRAAFGACAERVPVSATKSMSGHLIGAAGALAALFCVRAIETGWLPPTINLEHPDPACALDHVANKARRSDLRAVLCNGFGFGGANASLVLGPGEG